ncbi:hypothetical protein D3C71_2024850 [compost metagenome]
MHEGIQQGLVDIQVLQVFLRCFEAAFALLDQHGLQLLDGSVVEDVAVFDIELVLDAVKFRQERADAVRASVADFDFTGDVRGVAV